MLHSLVAHADHPPGEADSVEVEFLRQANLLDLRYRIGGAEAVAWPGPAAPERTDELWRTTCFELFLLFDDGERYVEFNFSPSGRWAAYAFDGYRDGMVPIDVPPPVIGRDGDVTTVRCDLSTLPYGEPRLGLSAVIEERDGTKSYWALAHAPGPPDFHNPACFIATLPAPDAP